MRNAATAKAMSTREIAHPSATCLAADMGAYRTVLTHFSQRYPGLPPGLPRGGPLGAEPIVAFDGMRLPLRLLPGAPLLTREVGAFLEEVGQAKARRGEGGAPEEDPLR